MSYNVSQLEFSTRVENEYRNGYQTLLCDVANVFISGFFVGNQVRVVSIALNELLPELHVFDYI